MACNRGVLQCGMTTPHGWHSRYLEIVKEFGYDARMDNRAASVLDSIIRQPVAVGDIRDMLKDRTVFVIGAGPSIARSIPVLHRYDGPKIAADSAARVLIQNGIIPDIVVTDLDGDHASLRDAASAGSIMIVHAHGDNIEKLPLAGEFARCIGTTQGRIVGRLCNFGGFTDGDRAVFMASAMGARKIILFGMDLGTRIGSASGTARSEKATKRRKLCKARELLEWMARDSRSALYTTSSHIEGFKRISHENVI